MLALYLAALDTQKDKDKFEQIYIKYKQDMYKAAFKILRNDLDAEDAVHQSFLKIADNFTKISHFSCQEFKPYVVIVCRNTAIDIYRANKHRSLNSVYVDTNEMPDDKIFENEDYFDLYSAIKELPLKYKEVLFFVDYMGLPAKEAAKELSISIDLVYKRVSRARSMLKEKLDKEGINV